MDTWMREKRKKKWIMKQKEQVVPKEKKTKKKDLFLDKRVI